RRWGAGDKLMALVVGGGYAEYCVAHESHALPVPAGLTLIEAAAIPETFFTVWHNVFERGACKRARLCWCTAAPLESAPRPSRSPKHGERGCLPRQARWKSAKPVNVSAPTLPSTTGTRILSRQ